MRRQEHQSGFGTLEILLIVLIVSVIAVGSVVQSHHYETISVKNSAATSPSQTTTQPLSTTATQSAQPEARYLTITEWGVRLALDSKTETLYYYINPQNANVAYFSLKTVSNIAPLCAADKTSLAAIYRLTSTEHQNALNNPVSASGAGTLQVGNYWYGYSTPQASCYDTVTETKAITKAQSSYNLADTFKTLEAAPSTN